MKRGRWAMAAVSMVLGLMLVSQYRMTRSLAENDVNLQRAGDLALQLTAVERDKSALEEQLATIKKEGTGEGVKKENEQLRLRAGLTDVGGPGVVVTINDSKKPVKTGENPNLYLIHDEDILRVVNELRAGGAEAISINDQRLLGTSEIRCAGPTVTVNGKIFAPPFVVKAIGDPKTLSASLAMRGGVVDSLKYWGIEIKVEKSDNIVIPAYTGLFHQNHLREVKKGDTP